MKEKLSFFKSRDVILTSIYTAQFKCCLALPSSRDGREMKKPKLTGHQALCGCPAYVPLTTMTRSGRYHPCLLHTAGRAELEHKLICLQSPQCSFISCCHTPSDIQDVATCLPNRELSHQFTYTWNNKEIHMRKIKINVAGRRELCSKQITCVLLQNYFNSRNQWHLYPPCLHFIINWVSNLFKNCPYDLSYHY